VKPYPGPLPLEGSERQPPRQAFTYSPPPSTNHSRFDAANQVETEQSPTQITSFTFDANGNTQVENAGGSLTTYTWNVDNMCVGIALPNGTLNTFAYDGDLKRRQAQDSSGLAQFINDRENVLAETDGSGSTQVAYTMEPATYGNLIAQRRSGASAWHLFDALGSTERLTSSDQAATVRYLHKAFGLTNVLSGSSLNRYTWVGRLGYRWEPDAQRYDIRRRCYDPSRAVWLASDPLVSRRTARTYRYASSNPITRVDPSGLRCWASLIWKEFTHQWHIFWGYRTLRHRGQWFGGIRVWTFSLGGRVNVWAKIRCDCWPTEDEPIEGKGPHAESKKHWYQWYQGSVRFKDRITDGPYTQDTPDFSPGGFITAIPSRPWRKVPCPGHQPGGTSEWIFHMLDDPGVDGWFIENPAQLDEALKIWVGEMGKGRNVGEPPCVDDKYFRTCVGESETKLEVCTKWGYLGQWFGLDPGAWSWAWRH
jgi:RHS repeat-associated protein